MTLLKFDSCQFFLLNKTVIIELNKQTHPKIEKGKMLL